MTKQPVSWSWRKALRLSATVGRELLMGLCLRAGSMIVARHEFLRDALILDRGLEHHPGSKLIHHGALDFLPWCLARWIAVAAVPFERGAALRQIRRRDEHVDGAFVEVDAHTIAGL